MSGMLGDEGLQLERIDLSGELGTLKLQLVRTRPGLREGRGCFNLWFVEHMVS